MKINQHTQFLIGICMLATFALWTAAVCFLDVQPIGPLGSAVGFATINRYIHSLTGVHMALYLATDWLSLIPLGCIIGFAILGLVQWARRKHLWAVDRSILLLGGFYLVVAAVYWFFEIIVINYRPVLIDGVLEPSYPSSTTMLVLCVMPTAILQLNARIRLGFLRKFLCFSFTVFTVFMVLARLCSGVHWPTDIIGGALLSTGLVSLYTSAIHQKTGL